MNLLGSQDEVHLCKATCVLHDERAPVSSAAFYHVAAVLTMFCMPPFFLLGALLCSNPSAGGIWSSN